MFSLLLSRSIPVRIGVAHGLFVLNFDVGVFVGPALVKAYRLGEEAQWLGAVLDDTVAERTLTLQPPFQDVDGARFDRAVECATGKPIRDIDFDRRRCSLWSFEDKHTEMSSAQRIGETTGG